MKITIHYSVLLPAMCLLIGLSGCTNDPVHETTAPAAAPSAATSAVDPAEIYAAAMEALGTDAVSMKIEASRVMTVAGQNFYENSELLIDYWNIGTENFLAHVKERTNLYQHCFTVEEFYEKGYVYQALDDCLYGSAMGTDDFMARYPSMWLLDPDAYTMTLEENNTVIHFSEGTGIESWLTGKDAKIISAEATVTLDADGTIAKCRYTAEYTCGPGKFKATYNISYGVPGKAPAFPKDTSKYNTVKDIDGMRLLASSYGYLLQAKQYSSSQLHRIQAQAVDIVISARCDLDSHVTANGTDYIVKNRIDTIDSSGSVRQELAEKFIEGKYSSSSDGGRDVYNDTVSSFVMGSYVNHLLVNDIADASSLTDAVITKAGDRLLIAYTCSEAYARDTQASICAEYFGDADILNHLSSAYRTNRMDYYLAVDSHTLLPTACGYLYEGCHTIDGYDCLLIGQLDQSFDLAGPPSLAGIYNESVSDDCQPSPLLKISNTLS